jgi:hypothetical protein
MEKLILMFSGAGANDAMRGQMSAYGDALIASGLSVVQVTAVPEELRYAADQAIAGQVAFAVTWLGIGQDLAVEVGPEQATRNLWEALEVPLIKIQGDLPAYFADFHGDVPRNAVNLYANSEFVHFRHRWLPDARALTGILPPVPLMPLQRGKLNISARQQGKLVFLKNGNSPTELQNLWRERLPKSVGNLISAMAHEITPVGLKPGLLHIGDFVAEFLDATGIDPDAARDLVRFFTAQLDDYLRRLKSQMIAESLLDLPILVQGSLWEHVDFSRRRAQLVPGQDYEATQQIYCDQLGIIDMSPNVDTAPHERVQRAAGSYAAVLTNRQTWLNEKFPGFEELTFEFDPESIKARASDAIARPGRYIELGIEFGERFRALFPAAEFAARIVEVAELSALQWNAQKPAIQPFFVWPRGGDASTNSIG